MTTYPSEKHYLQDQVKSNNLAIKFLKKELNKPHDELKPDFLGTNEKIVEVYLTGIEKLKEGNKILRKKIKSLC